jgi:hypothetical protein
MSDKKYSSKKKKNEWCDYSKHEKAKIASMKNKDKKGNKGNQRW